MPAGEGIRKDGNIQGKVVIMQIETGVLLIDAQKGRAGIGDTAGLVPALGLFGRRAGRNLGENRGMARRVFPIITVGYRPAGTCGNR